jgi:hypothetical protein
VAAETQLVPLLAERRSIARRRVDAQAAGTGEPSPQEGRSCVRQQFEQARLQMQRKGDASR